MKRSGNKTGEKKNPNDLYEEFARPVRNRLMEYRDRRELISLAERLGFSSPRLTEMITMNRSGEYKRKITPYYLAKFIENGVISVAEILRGKSLDDLPERPRMFFERMMVPRRTLQLVLEAQRRGFDVERILHKILFSDVGP